MSTENLLQFLESQGYCNLKEIEGRGICGLMRFVFTTGLVYNMNWESYEGRYCFESAADAKEALSNWSGIGDPAASWIKHKGKIEYSNPELLNK